MVELQFSPVRHRIDVYVQEVDVLTTNTPLNPVLQAFVLPVGIIRNVKIVFPHGCTRHISLRVLHHTAQWLPVGATSVFQEDTDGQPLEFQIYREVWDGQQDFIIQAWNDGVDVHWNHTITVYFTCELSEVL